MNTQTTRKKPAVMVLYAASFLAIFVFLFWKTKFGFANVDESFYLTIPYRLCRGDSLLVNEWHLSQLSGFLLYPVMKIYLLLFGNTEGILLNFRILFTVIWAMSALFFCYRLSSISLYGAMLASLVYLIYTPFGLMALSYNSMGIMLMLNATIILATSKRMVDIQRCIAGVFFAGAVLCCPYLVILYVVFTVAMIILCRKINGLFRCWLMFSLGCFILLVIFLVSFPIRELLSKMTQILPQIFNDPDHQQGSIVAALIGYVRCIIKCNRVFLPAFLAIIVVTVVSKMKNMAEEGLILICLIIVVIQLDFLIENPYINLVMFPVNLIAPYCALHSGRKEVQIPFWAIWFPGGVYTFCIYLSSNQKFYAVSLASTVMTVASVVILWRFVEQLREEKTADRKAHISVSLLAVILLLGLQLCSELSLRYSSVFWEEQGMQAQTVLADDGPEKGILMTPERLEKYKIQEEDMDVIRADREIGSLLVLSENTYLYLCAEKDMATYSAWLSGVDDASVQRLDAYFDINPEKIADAVYIEPKNKDYVQHYVQQGYRTEELGSGAYLLRRGSTGET